ncbi:hypothetical protein Glove_707g69 [Diversispora epigaea]|uniref:Protein kinase domain-containing protein n=1 Tax=Diversispora epigaea TaxID=1348612 RepID=A0A397G4E8_9GLOM|nr:hypothetical protein Glove_707g69 [Diversispora epigaea]
MFTCICKECGAYHLTGCKTCTSKHFKNNFCKWTSGNEKIDKSIQDAQLTASESKKAIEWIPYNGFKDIKEIAKDGFGTIYYAKWIDGYITGWDIEKKQWKRYGKFEVVLKKFDNFENSNEEFLNELENCFKGITKDPKTNKYMIVLEYMPDEYVSKHFKNNFCKWTSGNEKIDKFIQDAQLNASKSKEAIEWIPYHGFKDIKEIAKGGFSTIYYAKWIDGYITGWDIKKTQWERCGNPEVVLKKFDNFANSNENLINEMAIHLNATNLLCFSIRIYGITKDPETNKYMMVLEYMPDGNLRDYLKNHFDNIDWDDKLSFLYYLTFDFIRFHRSDIIHQDFHPGNILLRNFKSDIRISDFGLMVLKKFDNFANSNENLINEMAIHLNATNLLCFSIRIYGITKDPETNKYMMVLEYMPDGNLRDYLKNHFDNIDWDDKLSFLYYLTFDFIRFHRSDIIHQDFHPGNILLRNFKSDIRISDFGLSKIVGKSLENSNDRNIFGVLPYIAPEVLCGEEYTKAADVYSFGITAYEIITGFAPYYGVPHDRELSRQICNGLRPKIPFHTPRLITEIIMRSWDARITHRPTFEELCRKLFKYLNDYQEGKGEITIQIGIAENFSKNKSKGGLWRTIRGGNSTIKTPTPLNYQTHPEAIYTSRLLNYSNLPKPKNEEIFEKELEEIAKSVSVLSAVASEPINMHVP